MNEVKHPKKPLIYYYIIAMLIVFLLNSLALPYLYHKRFQSTRPARGVT